MDKLGKNKIQNKQSRRLSLSRIRNISKKRDGLFMKAREFSTLSGSSVAILVSSPAGRTYMYASPSFDNVVDQVLSRTTAGPSIAVAGSFTTAASPSFDSVDISMLDQFLPADTAGCPSIDITADQLLPATTAGSLASNSGSFQHTLKALMEFDLEACDDLEKLLALRSHLDQVIIERTRLV